MRMERNAEKQASVNKRIEQQDLDDALSFLENKLISLTHVNSRTTGR